MRAGKARNRSVRYTPYPSRRPMLKFGVIADVQYADEDDGANFDKSRTRYYRDGLRKLRRAVDWWKREGVSFALDLGDVIDGGNGAKGEQDGALRAVLAAFDELGKPVTHVVGNHERMNFSKAALSQRKEWSPEGAGGRLYHSWCLPGKVAGSAWKVLVLNAYEHAAIRHDDPMLRKLPLCSEPDYTICRDLLLSRNPNLAPDERAWYSGVYWGSGLADSDARFLPYNGMFGAEQLRWARAEIRESSEAGQRVVVASHTPVFPGSSGPADVALDAPEMLRVLHECPGTVCAVLCGHAHDGGFGVDGEGIPHITMRGAIESDAEDCCAIVTITDEAFSFVGKGNQPSHVIPLKP